MRIGMIFECQPDGPDQKVCEYAVSCLAPNIEFKSTCLNSKPELIHNCGFHAKRFLNNKYDHVIIVWDLYPAWSQAPPSSTRDRAQIRRALRAANVPLKRISLICIEQMLEAWLLADERALSEVLSTKTRPVSIKPVSRAPDRIHRPKQRLKDIFKEHLPGGYKPHHAEKIASAVKDCTRMRRSPSFRRFARAVTGTTLKNYC